MFDQTNAYGNTFGYPGMQGAYQYTGAPVQKFNNVLTAEEIQKLQKKSSQFSLAITEDASLRARCNHRNAEGTGDTLSFNPETGEAECMICGYKFRPIDAGVSKESIQEDVSRIIDILQTIKLMFIDLPAESAAEFFPIIPLLEKVPQLFEFAAKNMSKHESLNWQYSNRNLGTFNSLQNLQNAFGQGFNMNAGFAPQQQPMMGQPMYGQPMYNQQPMMGNPFGYAGASTPGAVPNPVLNNYAPQTTGYQFQPTTTPAPVQPTVTAEPAPAPANDVVVNQTVTV